MANMQFTNNAATILHSGISSSALSMTVATGTGALFPTLTGSQYFYCTLTDAAGTQVEIVKVTARTSDTMTIVRGQDNTTAQAFIANDKVELRLVAASLNDFPKLDEDNTFTGKLTATTMNASNGIITNSATVSASYSIPSGSNGLSAGPVSVASGVTVTIPSGSVWSIV
jgi:hypothetical protein